MEHNLNDKHKRIRKRILIKKEPDSGSPEPLKQLFKKGPGSDHPFQRTGGFSQVPVNRPYDSSNRGPFRDRGNFKPGQGKFKNDRGFKKPFTETEDLTTRHKFFTRHGQSFDGIPQTLSPNTVKQNPDQRIRLNKFISNAGVCSRREADELITKGVIMVNGKSINELGYKIQPNDVVEYKGKRITEANHVYILLNKPKDTITTTSDPSNRPTVMDLVQRATEQRVFPIGRLDRNTTGVILLTNDGDFAQKLSHPSSEVKKVYLAVLDKPLEREHFEQLVSGVVLDDGPMNVDEIAYVDDENKAMIGVEIHSGKNRIIHRLFEHLGYHVRKLDRVVYAGLDKGGLRRSKWRFLRYDEVQKVLNSIKYYDDKKV